MLYAVIGAVFMIAMGLFAFLKGDKPEKNGAGVYLFAWFATIVAQQDAPPMDHAPIGVFLIDLGVLAAFAFLAWTSKRPWPLWASGVQLITVICHILLLTDASISVTSLFTVMNLNGYLIILCLVVGTFWAWQERKAAAEHEDAPNKSRRY
ncbi:hypothetical protein LTR94_024920 [Friedmanniomyces endolithicus]|nr:hypothetical protein LTR94_024920 [Friedmanniomyces endolithicus]